MSTEWHNITFPGELERHLFYRDNIPDWNNLNKTQRKKRKKQLRDSMNIDDIINAKAVLKAANAPVYSLDCCQPAVPATCSMFQDMIYMTPQVEEKRTDMYNNASATIAVTAVKDDAMDYILRRLNDIRFTLYQNLEAAYADTWPKSKKQAIEWIKEGNFRVTQPVADAEEYEWNYIDPFKWGKTDPDLKAKGKAVEALDKAYQVARDVVKVKTDEDVRLKALQDFEAFAV